MRVNRVRWTVSIVCLTAAAMVGGAPPGSAQWVAPFTQGAAVPEDFEGVLQSVSAVSASDVWAVGFHDDEDEGNSALIEHWDGQAWHLVDGPEVEQSSLYGVAALSKTEAWAVGFSLTQGEYVTLVEHWDGSSWTEIPSPSPGGPSGSFLKAVSARSANDVWAVGYTQDGTLVEHWDGSRWSVIDSPGGASTQLNGVSAVASNEVFAVGNTQGAMSRTFIVRWNGSTWKQMRDGALDKAGHGNRLDGVSASSATDAWAVGTNIRYRDYTALPLIEHWDGAVWQRVAGVHPGGHPGTRLTGVSALSPRDVWAVGFFGLDDEGSYQAFIEHWDGHEWTWTHTKRPDGSRDDSTVGIDALSPSRAWAAGAYTNLEESLTNSLTQNWNGQRWVQR